MFIKFDFLILTDDGKIFSFIRCNQVQSKPLNEFFLEGGFGFKFKDHFSIQRFQLVRKCSTSFQFLTCLTLTFSTRVSSLCALKHISIWRLLLRTAVNQTSEWPEDLPQLLCIGPDHVPASQSDVSMFGSPPVAPENIWSRIISTFFNIIYP